MRDGDEVLRARTVFHPQIVLMRGNLIIRDVTPWTSSVHALLRHLEAHGFDAPRVAGTGYDANDMETLTFVEGDVDSIAMFDLDGSYALGQMLHSLHEATSSYDPKPDDRWFPWRGRNLGNPSAIGHCDLGPWNIVRRNGMPVALIDWTRAGPVDPVVELAQACWLNAHLHDDVVAAAEGLPPLGERAKHLRAIVDGYRLARSQRERFVDLMIELAVVSAADDVDLFAVRKTTKSSEMPDGLVWMLAWQIRSAAWQIENRKALETALLR